MNGFLLTVMLRVLLFALSFAIAAAPPAKGQDKPTEPEPAKVTYQGEPLFVPLECRYDDLLRAGLVCNEDSPCDLYLELIGISGVDGGVFAIGNIHTSSATVSSVLLASHDGGLTWMEPTPRIAAASFEIIQFAGDDHGWIGGQEQDIDYSSQPFLLITPNGGTYWERRNVWGTDEDRSGAILEFYFETAQHGFLVIDRLSSETDPYELYESMNGGRSWSVRQISEERLSAQRRLSIAPEHEWRLSENSEAGAYDIERRQDGSWLKVASFSRDVGTCIAMDTGEEGKDTEVPEEPQPEPLEPTKPVQTEDGVLVIPGAR